MAVKTADKIQIKQEGGFASYCFIINSATAADTLDIGSKLNGRVIANVSGSNVSDGLTLAYTFTAAGVITVPAGPATDKIAIIVDMINA